MSMLFTPIPHPHVLLHRIVMALLTRVELLPAETNRDSMLGPEDKAQ